MRPHRIRAIAVVVPVRDEEALLSRCLFGITAAVEELRTSVRRRVDVAVAIVLDSCTDNSEEIARRFSFHAISTQARNVGRARAFGVDTALHDLADTALSRVWIANTDGDSFVPRNWLTQQLTYSNSGWDLVLGTVQPDVADLAPEIILPAASPGTVRDAYQVYGANLGVRASRYRSAGGFPALGEHEDVRLVEALRGTGARSVTVTTAPVLTSARMTGRTPGGYAGYLRRNLIRGT